MADSNKITFIKQEFTNSDTGEKVPGVSVIIDGTFKKVCDKLIAESTQERDYASLIYDALLRGINELIEENKQQKQ